MNDSEDRTSPQRPSADDHAESLADVDIPPPPDPFAGRMRAAIVALSRNPGDHRKRDSLAAMLGYGPGAQHTFNQIVSDLADHHAIDRRTVVMLRSLSDRVRKLEKIDDRTMMINALSADAPASDEDTVVWNRDADEESSRETEQGCSRPPGEGDIINGRFELKTLIGVGGMAVVFRALDLQTNRDVAVKILKDTFLDTPGSVEAFTKEAQRIAAIDDPGVVKILASGTQEDRPYTVMEYLNGTLLSEILKAREGRSVSWARTLNFVNTVGRSLVAAHAKGIVHCDLKPSNLIQLSDGSWRVFDFGIAQDIQQLGTGLQDTSGGRTETPSRPTIEALTPAYASPEQLRHMLPDTRDDIFSLAVITYEMLTGLHPFDRLPAHQASTRRLQPPRPKALPNRTWRTLRRGFAFDRDQRPKSMASFLSGLRKPRSVWPTILVLLLIALGIGATSFPDQTRQVLRDFELGGRVGNAYFANDKHLIQSMIDLRAADGPLGQPAVTLARPILEDRIRRLAKVDSNSPTERIRLANWAASAGHILYPNDKAIGKISEWPFHLLLLDLAERLALEDVLPPEALREDILLLRGSDPQQYDGVEDVIIDLILQRLGKLQDPKATQALIDICRDLFPKEHWTDPTP